ncbi:HAMP domain-containing histidine kinase [Nocardioides humilatus]|uniref:histidine kinase n=1 Tax=Nocardioides humilatus TaxID=2607660 RepID=A0A5B1LB11_9ACTN|nr:HAMP domain-containing sensor histidine kinase [Nocardioides humilatus]KAA1416857.1 HAMP domain-containing histidine kinase [Nocardioides humilatus]
MRERLVAAFVGLTIVVVGLYGIPRAYVLADLVRDQEQSRIDRTADLVSVAVEERRDADLKVDVDFLDSLADDGEGIIVWAPSGKSVRTTDYSDPSGNDISARVETDGGTVIVTLEGDRVGDDIAEAILPLVLLGLLLVLLAGAAGYLLSRRIARPFQDLAVAARGLGAGQFHPDLPDSKVPEAREIAAGLRSSGRQLDELLQHERDIAVHASHELRTPITALRLELEDLSLWPETPESVNAQLQLAIGELDRLSAAVNDLLAVSRSHSAAAEIDLDLDALIADTVARVAELGRRVTHVPSGPLPTHLDPSPVVKALELLVGGGSEVRASDRGTHLEISITTGGQDAAVASRHRGPASDLVAAAGGSLTQTTDGVLVRLPKRPVADH